MVEQRGSIAPGAARSKRVEQDLDQTIQIMGILVVTFRGLGPFGVPNLSRVMEMINSAPDDCPPGCQEPARQLVGERVFPAASTPSIPTRTVCSRSSLAR